ncbi:hypothetical protein O6H91_16G030300 [Diphasiastrum complanatum]|uniref:Uncharacterized protein n=1 Tax=Diphasiastrum complanatum TaxID=34168 RepID=A0ACC2BC27_DIPCM|nr:hypothetical protein O6H91_16G030300 [Diphasiastrum complanatum]
MGVLGTSRMPNRRWTDMREVEGLQVYDGRRDASEGAKEVLLCVVLVWRKWMGVKKKWVDGALRNSKGELKPETKNELKSITPYLLQPLQGLLETESTCCLTKFWLDPLYLIKRLYCFSSLKEFCELTKNRRNMAMAIEDHIREEYGVTLSQLDMFKRYQINDAFIDDMYSRCPSWCEDASKRHVKTRADCSIYYKSKI